MAKLLIYTVALVVYLVRGFYTVTGGGSHPVPDDFRQETVAVFAAVLIPWTVYIWRS